MATIPAERSVYPFSTRDADSIPLDIIDPAGLMILNMGINENVDFIIPTDYLVGFMWSELGAIIQMLGTATGFTITNPLASMSNASRDNVLWLPPQTLLTVKFTPGNSRLVSYDPTNTQKVFIQNTIKWNTLGLKQQVTKK